MGFLYLPLKGYALTTVLKGHGSLLGHTEPPFLQVTQSVVSPLMSHESMASIQSSLAFDVGYDKCQHLIIGVG